MYSPPVPGEQSRISPYIASMVRLYQRCVMFKDLAFPNVGGVLDQNEMIVQILETIHAKVLELREAFIEQEKRKAHSSQTTINKNSRQTRSA